MRAARLASALACLLAAGTLVAGCGGGAGSGSTGATTETAKSRPAPPKGNFPSPEGRSLGDVLKLADGPSELMISPEAMVFYPGENRYPFSVSERDRAQVTDAEVALYFSRVPTPPPGAKSKSGNKGQVAKAQAEALEEPAVGPFPASIESLATKPAFRARTTAGELEPASVVYSASVKFPGNGEWRMAALIKEGDALGAKVLSSAVVGQFKRVPRPGQTAPQIHTPTPADVGGDLSKLTTRVPPDTQNKVDYAEALGREPIVLLFATPKFCQSRVCGPVVDVAEQAKQEYGDKAAFIHMEIYNDNDPGKGVRPQVRAFHLPSEPWLFTINSRGKISSAVEGGFGHELMTGAVGRVVAE